MKFRLLALISVLALSNAASVSAATPTPDWTEGVHYVVVEGIPRSAPPAGKVTVTEVFSYGCPACNEFNAIAHQLQAGLPKYVIFSYVPAGFIASEDWPMFQRAYCTAESLGIAAKTHDAMFDAVWKTGELSIMDPNTRRLKNPMPSIEDAARFYAKHAGVRADEFVAAAKSFDADRRIREANQFIKDFKVVSTPTIIVNSKYHTDASMAGGYPQLVALVNWLVAKEKK